MAAQSVRDVASTGTIPPEFVWPAMPEAPRRAVPIINLSGGSESASAVAAAARDWGIFQVVGHGVPEETMSAVRDAGRRFFEEATAEEKAALAMVAGGATIQGYGSSQISQRAGAPKTWVDYHFHNISPPESVDYAYWPSHPPQYRQVLEEYAKHLEGVLEKVLRLLSLGLSLGAGELKEAIGGERVKLLLRMNYYPPCPCPEAVLGIAAHSDMSALTLLLPNDVPGLQFLKDGEWFEAEHVAEAIIVHVGDQIEILSNGRYRSPVHRTTVSSVRTRMSWPVFAEPPPEQVIGPLPAVAAASGGAKYKTKKYKDYQYCKMNKLPQ